MNCSSYFLTAPYSPEILEIYAPEGGLINFLTQGRMKTNDPKYGAVALFFVKQNLPNGGQVGHVAIVPGKSQNGDVYLLQKLNAARGIVVTTNKCSDFAGYNVVYYQ